MRIKIFFNTRFIAIVIIIMLISVSNFHISKQIIAQEPTQPSITQKSNLTIDNILQLDESCHSGCWWGLEVGKTKPEEWRKLLDSLINYENISSINELEQEFYFVIISESNSQRFEFSIREQNNYVTKFYLSYRLDVVNEQNFARERTYTNMHDVFSILGEPDEIMLAWNGNILRWENFYRTKLERIQYHFRPESRFEESLVVCPMTTPADFLRIIVLAEGVESDFDFSSSYAMSIEESTDFTIASWSAELLENPEACITIRVE